MPDVSEWVLKNLRHITREGSVLDVACGRGRHTLLMRDRGYKVTAVDKDISTLQGRNIPEINLVCADLEENEWPFQPDQFDAIVVTNYLWGPLFPTIKGSLRAGGCILYETFAIGNEAYGRPSNPDFLLKEDELLEVFSDFEILDYFHGKTETPKPAVKQAVVARRP